MNAIYQQIKAAEENLKALKQQLLGAEQSKAESLESDGLSYRHSLDRARVEMLEAAIVKADLNCQREELLLALYEADKAANEAQQEYFREQERVSTRPALKLSNPAWENRNESEGTAE